MEGLTIELIMQGVSLVITGAIGIYLVQWQRREMQASTADHSVAAAQGAVGTMQALLSEHRQQIADLKLGLTQSQEQIAVVKRDSARKDIDHDKQVNNLGERMAALENEVKEERKKREAAEEEVRETKKELTETKERVKLLEEFLKEKGYDPDKVVEEKSAGK